MPSLPPPGFYTDPSDASLERWWDGEQWGTWTKASVRRLREDEYGEQQHARLSGFSAEESEAAEKATIKMTEDERSWKSGKRRLRRRLFIAFALLIGIPSWLSGAGFLGEAVSGAGAYWSNVPVPAKIVFSGILLRAFYEGYLLPFRRLLRGPSSLSITDERIFGSLDKSASLEEHDYYFVANQGGITLLRKIPLTRAEEKKLAAGEATAQRTSPVDIGLRGDESFWIVRHAGGSVTLDSFEAAKALNESISKIDSRETEE